MGSWRGTAVLESRVVPAASMLEVAMVMVAAAAVWETVAEATAMWVVAWHHSLRSRLGGRR